MLQQRGHRGTQICQYRQISLLAVLALTRSLLRPVDYEQRVRKFAHPCVSNDSDAR